MQNLKQFRVAADGLYREETYQGRKHLVVPVVALVEGVVQAMNASKPELVTAEEFAKWPAGWNGRPVFLNHPLVDGSPVSGNSKDILEEKSIGIIFNSKVKKGKLTMEAWIDVDRATEVAPTLLERITAGDPIEISVGVFAETDDSKGEYQGKNYEGAWRDLVPDHLALLDEDHTGACSRKMGCGVRAAAKGDVVAKKSIVSRMLSMFRGLQTADEMSTNDLMKKLSDALRKVEPNLNYVQDYYPVTAPDRVVFSVYEPAASGYTYCLYERPFELSDSGVVAIGDARVQVEPVVTYEPVSQEAAEPVAATEEVPLAPAKTTEEVVASQGTEGHPCSCKHKALQEPDMNKEALAKFLETASPEQIAALSAAAEGTNPTVKAAQEAAAKAAADLKAAQEAAAEAIKAAEAKAAADVKAAQEDPAYVAFKAAAQATKEASIKALKDTGRCDMTDEALKAMSQADLDRLVKLAGAPKVATDFSAQAPRETDVKAAEAPAAPSLIDAVKAASKR